MTDWRDLLSEQVRQLEAETGNPVLTPKALALLRMIRGYERPSDNLPSRVTIA
jgi:hypothetical protein